MARRPEHGGVLACLAARGVARRIFGRQIRLGLQNPAADRSLGGFAVQQFAQQIPSHVGRVAIVEFPR